MIAVPTKQYVLALLRRAVTKSASDPEFRGAAVVAGVSGAVAAGLYFTVDDENDVRRFFAQTSKPLLALWVVCASMVWLSAATHARYLVGRFIEILREVHGKG
jgi:hypothetical protein